MSFIELKIKFKFDLLSASIFARGLNPVQALMPDGTSKFSKLCNLRSSAEPWIKGFYYRCTFVEFVFFIDVLSVIH